MGGDDDHSRQAGEELLEERHRDVVEVVGRLVEQHALGSPGDEGRERQTHPLPAGHRGHRPGPVHPAESEPGRGGQRTVVGVPRVVQCRPVQQSGVLVLRLRVVEVGGEVLETRHRVVEWRQRGVEHVAHGRAVGEGRLLRQVGQVGRRGDRSGVGLLGAREQSQERGLARAVLTDEPEGPAGVRDEVDAVEHDAVAVRPDEVARDERGQGGMKLNRHERHRSFARRVHSPGTGTPRGVPPRARVRSVSALHVEGKCGRRRDDLQPDIRSEPAPLGSAGCDGHRWSARS